MARAYRIRVVSRLAADPKTIWDHATTIDGVNLELAPVHMHAPKGARLDESMPLDRPAGRGFVTLFRVFPIDFHELRLVDVVVGRSFHEHSRTLLEAHWIHKRRIDPCSEGTRVEDDVTFQPRAFGAIVSRIVPRVFARRHRYLRRRFGGPDRPSEVIVESLEPQGSIGIEGSP
jgi:hypothetical protein